MVDAGDILKGVKVFVWHKTYAIIKANNPYTAAFANITDKKETTVVIAEDKADDVDAIEVQPGWRILTFDATLPLDLIGFLAEVAEHLSDAKVSIFCLSTFSSDHVLVKDSDLSKAEDVLEKLGCVIVKK
jgi:hypothetical protein